MVLRSRKKHVSGHREEFIGQRVDIFKFLKAMGISG